MERGYCKSGSRMAEVKEIGVREEKWQIVQERRGRYGEGCGNQQPYLGLKTRLMWWSPMYVVVTVKNPMR